MMKLLSFLAFIGLLMPHAASAAPLRLNYAVFGSGLHAVNATLSMEERKGGYTARLNTTTTGFLAKVAPWSSHVISEGSMKNGQYMPLRYENTTIWKDDASTVLLNYDKSGRITGREVRKQGEAPDRTPADPALTRDAVDIASGIIRFFRTHEPKDGCTGQFNAYDGKRRYKVILANQAETTINKSRYTIYQGPALSCTVEIVPDGGKWSKHNRGWFKIQEDSRKQGGLPRIAVASMPDKATWLIPVRLDLASPYGNFVMHLTGASQAVK